MVDGAKQGRGPIAVLTGDLVGSRDLSVAEIGAVRERVAEAGAVIAGWKAGLLIGGPQFFRGDSWQLAIAEPGLFLRVAIGVRASLRALDTRYDSRIGVAVGRADHIDRDAVSLSVGEVFTRSGQALDAMKGDGFRFWPSEAQARRLALLPPLMTLCADTVGRLQAAQADAVWLSLAPAQPTHQQVAEQRGVTRQTITRALADSGFAALGEAIDAVEKLDWSNAMEPKVQLI